MSNSSLKAKYGNVWDEIAAANSTYKEIYPEYSIMQFNNRLSSKYFAIAEQLVSGARGNQPILCLIPAACFTGTSSLAGQQGQLILRAFLLALPQHAVGFRYGP